MEKRELTCIGCPLGCSITVTLENGAALPLARGKYDAVNRAFIARM